MLDTDDLYTGILTAMRNDLSQQRLIDAELIAAGHTQQHAHLDPGFLRRRIDLFELALRFRRINDFCPIRFDHSMDIFFCLIDSGHDDLFHRYAGAFTDAELAR